MSLMGNDIDESCREGAPVAQIEQQTSGAGPGTMKKNIPGHENIVFFDSQRIRHLERMIDLFHVLFRR